MAAVEFRMRQKKQVGEAANDPRPPVITNNQLQLRGVMPFSVA
jgi:hypothetical protein